MENILNDKERRVLGSLIEKEMATPEHYPLSLNALTSACNQKSNRDPVVSYDEATVLQAVSSLKEKKFAWESHAGRVTKYSQNFTKIKDLTDKEAAVICLLLLRGPQTLGELRARSERLHKFESLAEVEEVMNDLADQDLTVRLPRQPGRKEARYTHQLGGKPDPETASQSGASAPRTELEQEVAELKEEIAGLRREFHEFKKQFE